MLPESGPIIFLSCFRWSSQLGLATLCPVIFFLDDIYGLFVASKLFLRICKYYICAFRTFDERFFLFGLFVSVAGAFLFCPRDEVGF